ncbi:DUF2029 domain-containing protein [Rhodococcus sp. F64268]|uniref:DUF2029 domain-containing protein n=1 Tax=Rhodococcus sp. F64268 TaxID=2926402 RepID=UPI001FF43298|nr:DUF2029 domain-containing protein [Rhodococcus sp. F64268]MCK0092862.1 DUF2029 domain-containing protein [Rhodococcus sp. F64268]
MAVFMKLARIIGDLDDEFYRDERQRDVWNEASAVGFQLAQWAALVGGAVLPWLAGRAGAQIAIGVLALWFLISMAVIMYARARDVDVYATAKTWTPRVFVACLVYLAGIVGIYAQLSTPLDQDPATWAGAVVGGLVGGGTAVALIAWYRHRQRRRWAEEDARDLADR